MHVPDGFIDVPVSVAAGAAAAGVLAVAARRARHELDDRTAPLAGLVAAFVFAAQMMNFPIAAGTSGHLLGGALAAVLVGPWTATLALSVVLGVQALLFADGGLTALGVNILTMAGIGVLSGYLVARAVAALGRRSRRAVLAGAFLGAFVSVPLAAAGFVVLYALGGTTAVPLGTVALAMVGVHLLIGLGEALITVATVGAVLATRPDLVRLAARPQHELVLRAPVRVPARGDSDSQAA